MKVSLKHMEKHLFIKSISELTSLEERFIGNKARNIKRLSDAGYSTPEAFCISEKFFTNTIAPIKNVIDLKIKAFHKSYSKGNNNNCLRISAEIRKMIVGLDLPHQASKTISDFTKTLPHGKYAIRSSSAVEDGEKNSWAGCFDTELDTYPKDMLKAIKQVWASAYSVRALAYGESLENTPISNHMAVLVMPMIDAKCSGVAYSINHLSMNEGEMLVYATPGLADKIMSGNVDPERVICDKEREIAKFQYYSGNRDDRSAKKFIRQNLSELIKTIKSIEHMFDGAVDVEWAFGQDGNIYILQARPLNMPSRTNAATYESSPSLNEKDCWGMNEILNGRKGLSPSIEGTARVVHFLNMADQGEYLNYYAQSSDNLFPHIRNGDIVVTQKLWDEHMLLIDQCAGFISGECSAHIRHTLRERDKPIAVIDEPLLYIKNGDKVRINQDGSVSIIERSDRNDHNITRMILQKRRQKAR